MNLPSALKVFSLGLWLFYALIANSPYKNALPHYRLNDARFLDMIEPFDNRTCIKILGGSNARMGISASTTEGLGCDGLNLAITTEGGGFYKYIGLIRHLIHSEIIIYSSAEIWSTKSQPRRPHSPLENLSVPDVAIVSQIKSLLTFPDSKPDSRAPNGDHIGYKCRSRFRPLVINDEDFRNATDAITEEFIARAELVKSLSGARVVVIRIPPIYSETKRIESLNEAMALRIQKMRANGLIVADGTIATDKAFFFCDSFHPNDAGRQVFSHELRKFLMDTKIVNALYH